MVSAPHAASPFCANWFITLWRSDRHTWNKPQWLLTSCCWLRGLLFFPRQAWRQRLPPWSQSPLKNITRCFSPPIFLVLVFLCLVFILWTQELCQDTETFDCLLGTLVGKEFNIAVQFHLLWVTELKQQLNDRYGVWRLRSVEVCSTADGKKITAN